MPSNRKKVIVRSFNREWAAGYLPPSGFVHAGQIELLDLAGKVAVLPFGELKWICFVRDFNSGEIGNPERLLRKNFAGRPRMEGVHLRLQLRDGDSLEGIAANDLTLLDPQGILLTPPDLRSNTQRIFIPRLAIAGLEAVAVIAGPKRPQRIERPLQEDLFSQSQ